MDELFGDFLAESGEQLEAIEAELNHVDVNGSGQLPTDRVCRLIHAIKCACGFLNLPCLEMISHAAETLALKIGADPSRSALARSLILKAIERMRAILTGLREGNGEPPGDDQALIARISSAIAEPAGSGRAPSGGQPSYGAASDHKAGIAAATRGMRASGPLSATQQERRPDGRQSTRLLVIEPARLFRQMLDQTLSRAG
jgi:chemotaxis protein histidine kinase CheA